MPLRLEITEFVSFHAPFGHENAATLEDGGLLDAARLLADGLAARGLPRPEPEEREGWAYDFSVAVGGTPVEVIVASTSEEHPFVVSFTIRGGFLSLTSAERARLETALSSVTGPAHATLATDSRISQIRWFTFEAWNRGGPSTHTPARVLPSS